MATRMWLRSCGIVLAVVAGLGAPGAALAHDHMPPDALLVTDLDSGEGNNYTVTWARGDRFTCTVMVGDGIQRFEGPPVQWIPGTDIAVRFETRHRPTRVRVTGYLVGDPLAGVPIYGAVRVPYELRRVKVDGKIMWEAVLSPPPAPDLYLDVVARWKDQDGCGMQESAWTFRAGLLPI